jgi:hypothetical protein
MCVSLLIVIALFAAQGTARADFEATATLSGVNERPLPHLGPGTGFADIFFFAGTDSITYSVTFSGLFAPATASHIHIGPASGTGPVVLPFTNMGPPSATSGTFSGILTNADIINQATSGLTDITQIAAQILAGNAYVNIHDSVFPGGDIRGQLAPLSTPEPTSLTLFVMGAAGLLGHGWRRRGRLV